METFLKTMYFLWAIVGFIYALILGDFSVAVGCFVMSRLYHIELILRESK